MNKILNKYNDCNKFSLTGKTSRYNFTISEEEYERQIKKLNPDEIEKFYEQYKEEYNITEKEFLNALSKIEEKEKEKIRKIYEEDKEKFINYPDFDELYEEIKEECKVFDNEENRQYYINKLSKYPGMTEEKINRIKYNFFKCSFIADLVGKTTKYGNEHKSFFYIIYRDIGMALDREKDKGKYCISHGKSPLEQIPKELKEHFLYYEVSYFNSVTISGGLMINYYFKLNDETKKYLSQFRNDFYIRDLEDLTLYKDDEIKFYSCTHEGFNSIEFDYKDMSDNEIVDFINDEYLENNNDEIIEIVNKLINMEVGTKFSFKELEVSSRLSMDRICDICDKINLILVSYKNEEHNWATINEDGDFEEMDELPAGLCKIDDLIVKKR